MKMITTKWIGVGKIVQQKVVNVNFFGGIMSLINSPRKKLEKVIKEHNEQGYRVVFILPGRFNIVFVLLSMIILAITLLIWQPLPGYMVIFEKMTSNKIPVLEASLGAS